MTALTFNRRPSSKPPAISVICLNLNHREFLAETILSVLSQDFEAFEFLVIDGGSTDGSREYIREFPCIRLIDDPHSSRYRAIRRGYSEARGDIVMVTTSTDGYLCRRWFSTVHETFRDRPDVGLVWGASATMRTDGTLGPVVFPADPTDIPQKEGWFSRWIDDTDLGRSYLPELNYGIRADVLRTLLNSRSYTSPDDIDPILHVHFEFNRQGYLPYFVPSTANFGRAHDDQMQQKPEYQKQLLSYNNALRRYREQLELGREKHVFRDGRGVQIGTAQAT